MQNMEFKRTLSTNCAGYYYMNIPKAIAISWPKKVRLIVCGDHVEMWPGK